jgi:hypothetical protein
MPSIGAKAALSGFGFRDRILNRKKQWSFPSGKKHPPPSTFVCRQLFAALTRSLMAGFNVITDAAGSTEEF